MIGQSEEEYAAACRQQNETLGGSPRWENGAISHRSEYAAVWADFVFMAPPFMAYHAVATEDARLMRDAAEQCFLYRDVLSARSAGPGYSGAWMHIIAPELEDRGLWATGNAWAAGGMLRVLAAAMKWPPTMHVREIQTGLAEILVGMLGAVQESSGRSSNGLVTNFLDDDAWFSDAGSTAMMTAVVYRLAVLLPDLVSSDLLEFAHGRFEDVLKHVNPEDGNVAPTPQSGLPGWTVNEAQPEGSSQGHSFVVMMLSARRDWSRGA
jgi:rhamnogalacturonyl hydrolase YesR